jgi:hypothetical protein
MGDEIDDVMNDHKTQLAAAVAEGLAKGSLLEKLFSVKTTRDPQPFRVRSMQWLALPAYDGLKVATPIFETGYELSRTFRLTLNALRNAEAACLEDVLNFAATTRLLERRYVLAAVLEGSRSGGSLSEANIRRAVSHLTGECRLIASGTTAKALETGGFVAERIDRPAGDLPDEVGGLLVLIDGGPLVTRLIDDLTLTWRRSSDPGFDIELVVAERFFLDNLDTGFWFQSA